MNAEMEKRRVELIASMGAKWLLHPSNSPKKVSMIKTSGEGTCLGLAGPDVLAEVRAKVREQAEILTVEELRCAVVLQRLEIDQLRKQKAYELAVNESVNWIRIDDVEPPENLKMLLINENYGVACVAHYKTAERQYWTHWQGLPKFQR